MCRVFPTVTSCNLPNVGAGGGEQVDGQVVTSLIRFYQHIFSITVLISRSTMAFASSLRTSSMRRYSWSYGGGECRFFLFFFLSSIIAFELTSCNTFCHAGFCKTKYFAPFAGTLSSPPSPLHSFSTGSAQSCLAHPLLRLLSLCRHDICHKHHKQRLCKIISTRVKFYFLNVFLEHGRVYHFVFW